MPAKGQPLGTKRMPHRQQGLTCRTCNGLTLQEAQEHGVGFHRCPQCKGVWIGHEEFWSLYRHAHPDAESSSLTEAGPAERQCVMCDSTMQGASFEMLQLDQCPSHGIWCDTRELERALEDVSRRGLAREFLLRLRD